MIRKNSVTFILLLLSILPAPVFAFLSSSSAPPVSLNAPRGIPTGGPTKLLSFYYIFQNVVGWLFVIAMVLGVLMIIVAGIMYITAGSDETKAGKAMKVVMYALIGVAVAALAWSLVNVVGNYFLNQRLIAPYTPIVTTFANTGAPFLYYS